MSKVKDIMTKNPVFCTPRTSLKEVAVLMRDNDCGEIPVINDAGRKPLGVITDRDICTRAVALGKDVTETHVEDCMSSPCITIEENKQAENALALMEEHFIRRVVVVDKQGCLCGMIAQADIAQVMHEKDTGEMVRSISTPSERTSPPIH